jgi:hypothetical protein
MNKHSGVTVTVAVSLLTLCFSTLCCATGVYALADQGFTINIHPAVGTPLIGLGLFIWILPPLLSLVLVRGKENRIPEG